MTIDLLAACLLVLVPINPISEANEALPAAPASSFVLQPNAAAPSLLSQLKSGKWKAVEAQLGGQAMPAPVVAQLMPGLIQFGDGKAVVLHEGKVAGEAPYSVDESVAPARMTIDGALVANPSAAKRAKSTVIIRIEGDKLQICGGKDPANPPADFAADATNGNMRITYERVK